MEYFNGEVLLDMITSGEANMRNEIVMIPREKIFPHPQNPRKELGDLEELADSIIAQGVLQNLTVVPWRNVFDNEPPCEGAVVTVIGHRRAAAAEKAHVRELPCIIVDMDKQEQVATMLLENMQRSDLTVYEQAQGMQMMMDLGSSVEEISELTGFAPRTVQRRLQIAKLPEEAFNADGMATLRIEDYVELSKIEDPEVQKKVIKYAGTGSFDWHVKSALRLQAYRKNMELVKPMLAAAGYEKFRGKGNPYYDNKYERIWEAEPAEILKAGALPVTTKKVKHGQWFESCERIVLFDDAPPKKAEKPDPKRVAADQKRRELKVLCERAQQNRYDWISRYKPKREHEKIINRWYLEMSIRELSQDRGNPDYGLTWDAVQKKPTSKWYRPDAKDLMRVIDEDGKLAYITWVLTGDKADVLPYDPNFMDKAPEWIEGRHGQQVWKRAYDFLQAIGYPVSDEERSLLDGTHELYQEGK